VGVPYGDQLDISILQIVGHFNLAATLCVARLGSRMKCDEDILSVLHFTFNLTRLSQPSPCPMNSGTQTNFVQSMENI
ncbi:hypothetical protein JZX87_11500, partial [Agrobacterium sp. Ap1]|uniref:hypothetical protein n=1 Tax=Agrobacterium sp. Ap1 TaxID=2815337 RepID=UPI001A8DAABE